ncbi:MAG: hypothetical protein ACRDTA_24835 [Pseudonocardiaceae bacterium]
MYLRRAHGVYHGGDVVMVELLRGRLAELGVDPDDPAVVVGLSSVGATWVAWRSGPVEDWHAVPWCRIDGPQLARASVLITRSVGALIRAHVPMVAWRQESNDDSMIDATKLFRSVGRLVGDPDLRLPGGRTVASLAPSDERLFEFTDYVRSAVRRWTVLAAEYGLAPVLLMLACTAGWRACHWWGTPWWPDRVEGFLGQLDDPDGWSDPHTTAQVRTAWGELAELDRGWLRQRLLAGFDRLDDHVVASCLSAGLGHRAAVTDPRVVGGRFRDIAALIEPDTPADARRRAAFALEAESGRSW